MEMINNKGHKYKLMIELAMHSKISQIKIETRIGIEIPKMNT